MAAALTSFSRRRGRNIALLLLACALAWMLQWLYAISLHVTAFATGFLLLALCFGLAFFNARKKLPFIPLLRASTWTQIHIYAGWFSIVLFLLHIQGRWPDGQLETALAVIFAVVALSGVFGMVISRLLPARLSRHGENVLFERIPALRHQLQQEVEALVWKTVDQKKSTTIAEFYAARLQNFFGRLRHFWAHLLGSGQPLQKLLSEVEMLHRYLADEERPIMAEISECIVAKNNLDFQFANQALLKYWLFIHIPVTFSLLILGVVHGVIAFAFAGNFR